MQASLHGRLTIYRFLVKSDGQYYVERILWFLGKVILPPTHSTQKLIQEQGKPVRESYENRRNYAHSWDSTSTDPKDTTIYLKIVSWDSVDEKATPPIYPDTPGKSYPIPLPIQLHTQLRFPTTYIPLSASH